MRITKQSANRDCHRGRSDKPLKLGRRRVPVWSAGKQRSQHRFKWCMQSRRGSPGHRALGPNHFVCSLSNETAIRIDILLTRASDTHLRKEWRGRAWCTIIALVSDQEYDRMTAVWLTWLIHTVPAFSLALTRAIWRASACSEWLAFAPVSCCHIGYVPRV